MIKIILLILTTLISSSAFATTYYISSNTGNDSYTSSQATKAITPWKTLTRAKKSIKTGDKVYTISGIKGVGKRLAWGAFSGDTLSQLNSFEKMVGAKTDIKTVFIFIEDDLPTEFTSKTTTTLIYLENEGVPLDDIIAGKQDANITKLATQIKKNGNQVLLAPLHEMNGDWSSWCGTVENNTPAKVIAAWKRMYTIFKQINVPNARFLWVVNAESIPDITGNQIQDYWPGAAYVDMIGLDNFNGAPFATEQTFDFLFKPALTITSKYGKSILISSTGASPSTKKAAWITKSYGIDIKKYPAVIGWVWFNAPWGVADYRVNTDANSLKAFISIIPK